MSQSIEYCLSITPEPYESALTPEDILLEEIEAWAAAEENYAEAVAKHAAWKEARAAAEQEENLRLAQEVQAMKVETLRQKAEEKRKVEEKRQEEEWLRLLKEKQEAKEKQRLAELKAKVDAAAAKQQEELQRKKEKEEKEAAKKLRKEQKAEKAAASGKGKGTEKAAEAALVEEEKGLDVDTEEEVLESSKKEALKKLKDIWKGKRRAMEPTGSTGEKNKKRKWTTESASLVEETDGEGTQGPSKRAKAEASGSAEGKEEMLDSSKCIPLVAL